MFSECQNVTDRIQYKFNLRIRLSLHVGWHSFLYWQHADIHIILNKVDSSGRTYADKKVYLYTLVLIGSPFPYGLTSAGIMMWWRFRKMSYKAR